MKRYCYSKWDETQTWESLDAEELFDELMKRLIQYGDISWALEQLMQEGMTFSFRGFSIKGLNQLMDELRRARQGWFDTYNLNSAFDEIRGRLEQIVTQELESVSQYFSRKYTQFREELKDLKRQCLDKGGSYAEQIRQREERLKELFKEETERRSTLKELPRRLSAAIERLKSYDFLDQEAARKFQELLKQLESLRALERFKDKYGHRFRGAERLSFDEAIELMREMERLDQLESALERGDLNQVNMEDLKRFLGIDSFLSLQAMQQFSRILEEAGYLENRGGVIQLSPQGIRKIGQRALRDIYTTMKRDQSGRHQARLTGAAEPKLDDTKIYEYGDPFHLDLDKTFKNVLARGAVGIPLKIRLKDFEVHRLELSSRSSTALLLDMSWSMAWNNKFPAAKRVTLALDHLIRTQYPKDNLYIIGFFTVAVELKPRDLPTIDLNLGDPFTNIQDGLRLAERLLSRDRSENQQIIIITDGQPTAYFLNELLQVEWPIAGISPNAFRETLKEVNRITKKGIKINTFMLDEDPALVGFVEKLTKINRGRAFYTSPNQLGKYLLVDYIERKKKRIT